MSEIKPGDRIQPDSTVAAGVTNMRVAMADPATRWWLGGGRIRPTWSEVLAKAARYVADPWHIERGAVPFLASWPDGPHMGRGYLKFDGSGTEPAPLNAEPFLQDYTMVMSILAHEAITDLNSKLHQIIAAGSRALHPNDPHNDESANAYRATLDWLRGVIGMVWADCELWRANAPGTPEYDLQATLVKRRFAQLCSDCSGKNFVRRLQMRMNHKVHAPLLAQGNLYAMDRTSEPWGPGAFIGSKPGGITIDAQWDAWIANFKKALLDYDDRDLGNLQPRIGGSRPVYVDETFWPPSPVQY